MRGIVVAYLALQCFWYAVHCRVQENVIPETLDYDTTGRQIYNSSVIVLANEKATKSDSESVGPRVSYGQPASIGDFPYIGLMLVDPVSGAGWQCAATLIGPRVALTAAHCLDGQIDSINVAFKITERSEFTQKSVEAIAYVKHQDYSVTSYSNDIGLVNFRNAIDAPTVALSNIVQEKNMPNPLYVAGWGLTEREYLEGVRTTSDRLIYASVPPVTRAVCDAEYTSWGISPPSRTHICAGGLKSDACAGDSGGPLSIEGARWPTAGITENIQVGITSIGPVPCGGTRSIGAYTDVALYTRWINDNIYYFNYEGTTVPTVKNSLIPSSCYNGDIVSTTNQPSGGDCCKACKDNPNCSLWQYQDGSRTCSLFNGAGWKASTTPCNVAGWLNRNNVPSNVQTQSGYREYQGSALNVVTGATSVGACAQACVDTANCKYFTWLGPIGGETFNQEGANCRLADAGATPVESFTYTGNSWGTVTNVPPASPEPQPQPEPEPTPSPPPRVQPSPPPPRVQPSPPPPRAQPSPPPPPVERRCNLDGTYVIYAKGRSKCTRSTEYLGYWVKGSGACKSTKTKLKKTVSSKAPRWVIKTDSDGVATLDTVRPSCSTKGLTSSSVNRRKTTAYLSKPGNRWHLISADGKSCSTVIIESLVRARRGYSPYLSSSWNCKRSSIFTSSRVSSTGRQTWGVKRISDAP